MTFYTTKSGFPPFCRLYDCSCYELTYITLYIRRITAARLRFSRERRIVSRESKSACGAPIGRGAGALSGNCKKARRTCNFVHKVFGTSRTAVREPVCAAFRCGIFLVRLSHVLFMHRLDASATDPRRGGHRDRERLANLSLSLRHLTTESRKRDSLWNHASVVQDTAAAGILPLTARAIGI